MPGWSTDGRWSAPEQRDALRAYAVQLTCLVPAFSIAGLLEDRVELLPFVGLAVAAVLTFGLRLLIALRAPERLPWIALSVLDIATMGLAVALTGGADSSLRYLALMGLPTVALIVAPRTILAFGALQAVCIGGPVLAIGPREPDLVYPYFIALLAVTAATAVAAHHHRRVADRLRSVLHRALAAEQRERRRAGQDLHDRVLQTLLAAGQELDEVAATDGVAGARARAYVADAVGALRDEVTDLNPAVSAPTGTHAVLRAFARQALEAGLDVHVEVDEAAVPADRELLETVARELVGNAVRHAGATEVALVLRAAGRRVVLEVSDDGRGVDPAVLHHSGAAVGLQTATERVRSVGGELRVGDRADGGTTVRVELPAAEAPSPIVR